MCGPCFAWRRQITYFYCIIRVECKHSLNPLTFSKQFSVCRFSMENQTIARDPFRRNLCLFLWLFGYNKSYRHACLIHSDRKKIANNRKRQREWEKLKYD